MNTHKAFIVESPHDGFWDVYCYDCGRYLRVNLKKKEDAQKRARAHKKWWEH